jgi:hypothetical protein
MSIPKTTSPAELLSMGLFSAIAKAIGAIGG